MTGSSKYRLQKGLHPIELPNAVYCLERSLSLIHIQCYRSFPRGSTSNKNTNFRKTCRVDELDPTAALVDKETDPRRSRISLRAPSITRSDQAHRQVFRKCIDVESSLF